MVSFTPGEIAPVPWVDPSDALDPVEKIIISYYFR
jgi:hypothetical protein